jgi:hypothetical protein
MGTQNIRMGLAMLSLSAGAVVMPAERASAVESRTIEFSGYTWIVRSGFGGPGPNTWSPDNVWVDADGALHLQVSYVDGRWRSAEVISTQRFGFGRYQWSIASRVDQLDPNVVAGLFNYTEPDIGPDGTNEIDIEFARWGDSSRKPLNYAVYPAVRGYSPVGKVKEMKLTGSSSTHRFTWKRQGVTFEGTHGFYDTQKYPIASWSFTSTHPELKVPQKPLPVHMNLWLFQGRPPSDGKTAEIVIAKFTYSP